MLLSFRGSRSARKKARICVVEGPLLGDVISRTGRKPMGDRVQAVRDFAPLRDKQHIRAVPRVAPTGFDGRSPSNTLWSLSRWALTSSPAPCFPPLALVPATTEGDKAVRCIKAMAAASHRSRLLG